MPIYYQFTNPRSNQGKSHSSMPAPDQHITNPPNHCQFITNPPISHQSMANQPVHVQPTRPINPASPTIHRTVKTLKSTPLALDWQWPCQYQTNQTIPIHPQSTANPHGQACQSNNHPPNATPILTNRLPIGTDNVQIVKGTSTIGDLTKCLGTPSHHSSQQMRQSIAQSDPLQSCNANTLPIQYQSIANPMSIHCQSDVNLMPTHHQFHTNSCRSIAKLIPIHANPSSII